MNFWGHGTGIADRASSRDITHPAHTDGRREGYLLSATVLLAGLIVILTTPMNAVWSFISCVGLAVAVVASRVAAIRVFRGKGHEPWVQEPDPSLREKRAQRTREMWAAEQERRIAEAKASGAFDRFGPRD